MCVERRLSRIHQTSRVIKEDGQKVVGMGRFKYRERLEIIGIYSVHGRLYRADLVKI